MDNQAQINQTRPNTHPFFQVKSLSSAASPMPEVKNLLWHKCAKCQEVIYIKHFLRNLKVCPGCGYHTRLRWHERIDYLLDKDSFVELNAELETADPLKFSTESEIYADKVQETQRKTGLNDALVTGYGAIHGKPVALAVTDFAFLGASMGSVYGEKMVRLIDFAIEAGLPLLTVSSSGGARMHEGLFSLMQMAKTTAALSRLSKARLPHIALLADPCFGGVTASYTLVADIILTEPGTLIGFAGPRVIEQTTRQVLPPGFQTAEFLYEHGMVDQVVHRKDLTRVMTVLLNLFERPPASWVEEIVRQAAYRFGRQQTPLEELRSAS